MSGVGRPTNAVHHQPAADTALFEVNPAVYIAKHACVLHAELQEADGGSGGDAVNGAYNRSSCGTKSFLFLPTGTRLTAKLFKPNLPINAPIIKVMAGAGGKEVAFLPWQEDKCTATTLSDSAELFLTGPLSGCNVYLATKAGHPPMVFHGNSNTNSSDLKANNIAKDTEAALIASAQGYKIVNRLARGTYEIPAFVWGYRAGTMWTMFVHSFDVVSGKFTNTSLPFA